MIEILIDKILLHDKIIIVTDLYSTESLNKFLKLIMNYIGKENYIIYDEDYPLEDFISYYKSSGKVIIVDTLNVWLTNTQITSDVFDNAKFILPYRNLMNNTYGLPHFIGNQYAIPTKLLYTSDLVLSINNNKIIVQKIRSTEYKHSTKIDMDALLNDERTIKVNKIKKLIA